MLKMIIADDENIIREGLNRFIDWSSIGVEIIGLAENGSKALELILDRKPDIILSDISMPMLNGIELIELLRNHKILSEVIFISAYSNFDYAQSAIKFGAFDYILKPINEGELLKTVERCVDKVTKQQINIQLEDYITSEHRLKLNSAFLHLLYEPNKLTSADEHILKSERLLDHYDSVITACIWYENSHPTLMESLEAYIFKPTDNQRLYIVHNSENNQCFILLFGKSTNDNEWFQYFKGILNDMLLNLDWDSFKPIITVSKIHQLNQGFQYIYIELCLLYILKNKQGQDNSSFYYAYDTFTIYTRNEFSKEIVKDAIKSYDPDKIEEILLDFFFQLILKEEIYDIDILKLECIDLIDYVINELSEYQLKTYLNQDTISVKKSISFQTSLDVIYDATKNILINLSSCIEDIQRKSSNQLIKLSLQYIHENYNKEISLAQLADNLYISPTYLSKIFRSQVGVTFSRYVLEYRIDASKKLLSNPKYKIYEISNMCGFSDVAHFSKTFKQVVGVSPNHYKNQ